MNPTLAGSYSRAMQAALSGGGYSGARPVNSGAASGSGIDRPSTRRLFDFTTDHLPGESAMPVSFVQAVYHRIRNQDWSAAFGWLLLILVPSGFGVFVVRDRYYRRRAGQPIRLAL